MQPKQDTQKANPSLESYRHGSKEKDERERERERKPHGEAKPPKLLIIALFGLVSSCLHFALFACIFRSHALAPSVYMQQKKETKPAEEQRKRDKERKRDMLEGKQKKESKKRKGSTQRGKQACYQTNKLERVS